MISAGKMGEKSAESIGEHGDQDTQDDRLVNEVDCQGMAAKKLQG